MLKKILSVILGILLIWVGIAGIILPVMPGWVFVFMGLSLIAPAFAARLKRRVSARFFRQNLVYFEDWNRPNVHAAMTTRHCPVLFHKSDDLMDPDNQKKFRDWLSTDKIALTHGMTSFNRFIFLNQVHGDRVECLEDAKKVSQNSFHCLEGTDGVITNLKGLNLLVFTADCLSIYFEAKGWVGLVHAGWRGTQKQIAKNAFQMIQRQSGAHASEIHILFGPAIGKNSYEVGPEFKKIFPHTVRERRNKFYFDLVGENRRQLLAVGAEKKNIFDTGVCTVEQNVDFYSFRKEKDIAGRQVSIITLR